jgi:tetratricopeptide (TPR) repeat protein
MELKQWETETLKAEIEHTIGRKILTSKDCIDLSEAIFKKVECRINSNTLRRFFGLVKSEYPPSVSTLNILAAYCGASSFNELLTFRRLSSEVGKKEAPNLLKYMNILFENITVADANDPTFIRLTHNTIAFLNQNADIDMLYEFQKSIAKTHNGKKFYFEKFVNIDKLNSFYGNGLHYYLSENKSREARIFGYSLFCFRYWLTGDHQKLEYYHKKLMDYPFPGEIPPSIGARYFAARLYYAEAKNLATSDIIEEAHEFHLNLKSPDQCNNKFPSFEFILAEALILTGNYSEALNYTTKGSQTKFSTPFYLYDDPALFKTFELYHAIVLFNLGNEKKASEIFDRINSFEFYFITKQFHNILYLLLGMRLNKIRSGKEQLDMLIKSTGFKKLQSIFFEIHI